MKRQAVLVVDDEKNIRLTAARSLRPLEVQIEAAVNGEEALAKLGQQPFDLVFLDLKMPGMGGMEVLRRIRSNWPQVRVVIITAHGTIDTAVEAIKLGASDFLQKPFSANEIRDVARASLEHVQSPREGAVDSRSLLELVRRHIANRDLAAARETVCRVIAADPTEVEAYNLLGALLETNGDWLGAQKFYRAALDMDPTFKPAQANLERTTSWSKSGEIQLGADQGDAGTPQATPRGGRDED